MSRTGNRRTRWDCRQDDLTLVVGPALGVPSVSYGLDTQEFAYVPEPAVTPILIGLIGLAAARSRRRA